MALGQIRAAIRGNTRAFIEIQDSLFGKQANGLSPTITAEELEKLSDEELDKLIQKLDRGHYKTPRISIIEVRQRFEQQRQERTRSLVDQRGRLQ